VGIYLDLYASKDEWNSGHSSINSQSITIKKAGEFQSACPVCVRERERKESAIAQTGKDWQR
jgi:hypothetical protein